MDLPLLDRITHRAHDVRLADDVVEGLRAMAAVEMLMIPRSIALSRTILM